MGCLSKISQAILFDCQTVNGITAAVLINKADIASWDTSNDEVTVLTLDGAAKGVRVATNKRSITVTETLRVNDEAPNGFTHEAVIAVFNQASYNVIANQLANGTTVLLTKAGPVGSEVYRAYGMLWGLTATASTRSSHDNGGVGTFTLSTPEGVLGEDALTVKNTIFDTIYNAAIAV